MSFGWFRRDEFPPYSMVYIIFWIFRKAAERRAILAAR